jgi:hypothetical protein
MTTRLCVAALLVLAVSCGGSTNSTPGGAPQPSREKVSRNSNVISQAELQDPAVISKDALSAIRSLRPNFFAYHGSTGSETYGNDIMVSMDYGPLQSVQMLKGMNTMGLVEVRYLKAEEAALRFGLNANGAPVIVLLHNKNQ